MTEININVFHSKDIIIEIPDEFIEKKFKVNKIELFDGFYFLGKKINIDNVGEFFHDEGYNTIYLSRSGDKLNQIFIKNFYFLLDGEEANNKDLEKRKEDLALVYNGEKQCFIIENGKYKGTELSRFIIDDQVEFKNGKIKAYKENSKIDYIKSIFLSQIKSKLTLIKNKKNIDFSNNKNFIKKSITYSVLSIISAATINHYILNGNFKEDDNKENENQKNTITKVNKIYKKPKIEEIITTKEVLENKGSFNIILEELEIEGNKQEIINMKSSLLKNLKSFGYNDRKQIPGEKVIITKYNENGLIKNKIKIEIENSGKIIAFEYDKKNKNIYYFSKKD